MAQSLEEKLLSAIKRDDIKAFRAMAETDRLGNYRLGRFPVVSLLYLYKARKILSSYEAKFLKIVSWEPLGEPACISELFARKSGKCLRLYFDEIVSPLEMLLILDKTAQVKKLYRYVRPSEAVKERLKKIYFIKYSLNIKYEGKTIAFSRRPLNRTEKKRLFAAVISCILALVVIVVAPVTAVMLTPKPVEGEITQLAQIDFTSQNTYTLKNDIQIPEDFYVNRVNCTIIGNGHKLVLGRGANLGSLIGKFKDMEIQTEGSAVFDVCTDTGELKDITVNVNADVSTYSSGAFVVNYNYGSIDEVTVNVKGDLNAKAGTNNSEELVFGGIALSNTYISSGSQNVFGKIENCVVNYQNLTLRGETGANAAFGGIVGVNNGIIKNCRTSGDITADTFDLAGVCYANGYLLTGVVNEANLAQSATDEAWTPIVGGLVIENASIVENSRSLGKIEVTSNGDAICGGISARNYGVNRYCAMSGDISVTAKTAFVGGIYGRSEVKVSDTYSVYLGTAEDCICNCSIKLSLAEGSSCIGGIGGYVQEIGINIRQKVDENGNYLQDEDGKPIYEKEYWGGGATRCIFMGEINGAYDYIGNIIGVCAANIYKSNSFTSDDKTYLNFDGNYCLPNERSAFGATVNADETFERVEGKGFTALSAEEIIKSELYNAILERIGE